MSIDEVVNSPASAFIWHNIQILTPYNQYFGYNPIFILINGGENPTPPSSSINSKNFLYK
ncbi:hypothetical protein [Candidatus Nitrosocosmicus sp. SS]|uniref:hypothetical protein n=1 Tax=Candidatus Nitrosocosmicus agrestis TaxID=2563600 RepID=UPI0013311814|nr:hypothetical protein [Candidatus Nitrosocosmicus sp. SS]KAF0867788.1 hypothetical protein E5N71_13605 [Candidatus Nitrosocosmicus sp. SS]